MTFMQLAFAAIIIGLLIAIGWGVSRVLRHTGFLASWVAHNLPEDDDEELIEVSQPQDSEESTRPVGFGVRLRERN